MITEPKKKKRRWLPPFGVKTLLVLMLLLAIALTMGNWYWDRMVASLVAACDGDHIVARED